MRNALHIANKKNTREDLSRYEYNTSEGDVDMYMTYLTWNVMNAMCVYVSVTSSEPGQNMGVHSQAETQPPSIFTKLAKSITKSSKSLLDTFWSAAQ